LSCQFAQCRRVRGAYKTARSYEEALFELRRCAGTQFDPKIVEAFLESLGMYGDARTRQPLKDANVPIEEMVGSAFSRDAWRGIGSFRRQVPVLQC
jgi:hypothetical protein